MQHSSSNSGPFLLNAALVALALSIFPSSAKADTINLVTNGSFEQTLQAGSHGIGTRYPGDEVTGWTTGGYNFVFAPGSADTTGTTTPVVKLWGPGGCPSNTACSMNGMPATSPDGGNYVGMDGAYEVGALQQTITGLTAGQLYKVSFFYAGAQQSGYNGLTTEQFEVSLGLQNFYTPVLHDTNHGFTGWQSDSFVFTADGPTDVLSFLSIGTPSGAPPFSLLDGVTMSAVPEPSSIALMLTGLTGVGGMVRSRFKKSL